MQQARLVFRIESVESKLNPVGQELFKLRIDGIVDAAQTADRFAFSGGFRRETSRTVCAYGGFMLQQFDLSAGVFDPLDLVGAGGALLPGRQNGVQVLVSAPPGKLPLP